MSAIKKLDKTDVLNTVLVPSYGIEIVSGTAGWTGGDVSGSISLFGGIRIPGRSTCIRPTSGSFTTASISYSSVRLSDITESETEKGNRTWRTVDSLYRYYSSFNPLYSTSSYDYQCLFFKNKSNNIAICNDAVSMQPWRSITSSLCLEAWVKPFMSSSEDNSGRTILSRTGLYWFGVTGSAGDMRVTFSSSLGFYTSSLTLSVGKWSHVAVSVGSNTGSIYVGLKETNRFTYAAAGLASSNTASFSPAFCVGNVYTGSIVSLGGNSYESPDTVSSGSGRSFHGLIHEVREWKIARTWQQISSSHDKRIQYGDTGYLPIYMPMLDAHKSSSAGYVVGSGSNCPTISGSANDIAFSIKGYTNNPSWFPNGNPNFHPDKTIATEATNYVRPLLKLLNIPRAMYGSSIATGSFTLTCKSFSGDNAEIIRVIKDDGKGQLYMHSCMSASFYESQWSENVPWNRVGNIFYSEGVVVISDDSVLDLCQDVASLSKFPTTQMTVSFNGVSPVPVSVVSCHIQGDECNLSTNDSFSEADSSGIARPVLNETYISSVVLYDKLLRPVGVAKLAMPLRKRKNDSINIRLRRDF